MPRSRYPEERLVPPIKSSGFIETPLGRQPGLQMDPLGTHAGKLSYRVCADRANRITCPFSIAGTWQREGISWFTSCRARCLFAIPPANRPLLVDHVCSRAVQLLPRQKEIQRCLRGREVMEIHGVPSKVS